ncbi:MAG TPA: FoF1 ATP synthase subunit a [Dehalococcoidia bacterium]|nr:FoF1 ATP synthase subunit a [Dehalococcoidia bacterium]
MLAAAAAKRLLLVVGLVLVVLLLFGVVRGAIGSAILKSDTLIPQPEIHLPPQPIFPASKRELHLGLTSTATENASPAEPPAPAPAGGHEAAGGPEEAHSTPLDLGEFAITNTMLSAWFASVVIILFFVLGAGKKSLVPGRFQSVIESSFEAIINFSSAVLGRDMARKAFPIVATIFFFVLFNAWLGLLPFYQFLGFVGPGDDLIKVHLLRPAGTDLNMPLALALVSFVFVEVWGFKAHGFGYLTKFFAFGSIIKKGPFQGLIDVFVGLLELVSELIRMVSFTFRLFGNMTAGEILVVMITFLVPLVATNFVYGLELLVGLIQSVIFAGLTLVFLSVAVSHQEH